MLRAGQARHRVLSSAKVEDTASPRKARAKVAKALRKERAKEKGEGDPDRRITSRKERRKASVPVAVEKGTGEETQSAPR